MIDVDEIRRAHISAHGLKGADDVRTFYYDETNNLKKLRVREYGFNVSEPGVFVLGGVAHTGDRKPLDVQTLRQKLRIQPSAQEIKLKHLAKGDFLIALESKKLTTFLEWAQRSDLTLHYHALDPIYWSIVDIIDSILFGANEVQLFQHHLLLKADLARVLRRDLSTVADIFLRFDYPSIAAERRKEFLDEVLRLLEHNQHSLPEFNYMMLKGVLQMGRGLQSLEFIEGFTPHELIETFSIFYLTRLAVFKTSRHILDMEDTIRDEIEELQPRSEGAPLNNYSFVDSKSDVGVQISDILVGLLGKMYSYFATTPLSQIESDRVSLSSQSRRNADLLREMIDSSHAASIALINHVMSVHDVAKMNAFLNIEQT